MTARTELGQDTDDRARPLRRAMARRLTEPADPWHEAFARVPRHVFAPRFLRQGTQGEWETVSSADADYLEAVYADDALTTQLTGGAPTSSTSQPSLMLSMLHALDVEAGHNVLEIGTGTGYNAALLAHRLGDHRVTTIDVDPALTSRAVKRLSQADHSVDVHTGDGAHGVPERAPFDRIIATCGMRSVPWPWIEQAAEDAVIVAPIGAGLARITVRDGYVEGRFLPGGACFMPHRARVVTPRFDDLERAPRRRARLPVASALERLAFPLSLALPGYSSCTWADDETGRLEAVGVWTPDGSVACAHIEGTVQQAGPRRLWEAVEDLHQLFPETAPARDAFGLTLTPAVQRAWFGDPDGPAWSLPSSA